MKQTVLYNSIFKDFSKTKETIEKTAKKIAAMGDKGKEYLKSYDFIKDCTDIYNNAENEDVAVAWYILLAMLEKEDGFFSKDVAFVAFYLSCFHVYRRKDTAELRKMLTAYVGGGKKQFSIEEYPMIWDLACRYSALTNDYERLIATSSAGAKTMGENPAVNCSYIQAVINRGRNAYYDVKAVKDKYYPPCIETSSVITPDSSDYADQLITAFKKAFYCTDKNKTYAKYFFQVAELLFYTKIYLSKNSETLDFNHKKEFENVLKPLDEKVAFDDLIKNNYFVLKHINEYVKKAKDYAANDGEISAYDQFSDMADAYFDEQLKTERVFRKKNRIITSTSFKDCKNIAESSKSENYITISYSRKDYKSVLCDVVELMEARGVQIIFDENLERTNDENGKTWIDKYGGILKKSKAVICFLSENYISSESVEEELILINKFNKTAIPVDLTGQKQISKIIQSATLKGAELPSNRLKAITDVFGDKEITIAREKNADAVGHISNLLDRLRNQCAEVFAEADSCLETDKNRSAHPHPQEDAALCDDANNIYVVADGITRKEGYDSDYSVAKTFTEKFTESFVQKLKKDIKEIPIKTADLVKNCFVQSSVTTKESLLTDDEYVKELEKAENRAKTKNIYFESPGCVAAVAVIERGTLYYGNVGDCAVVLVRNEQPVVLTRTQTTYAFKVEKHENDRELLYSSYVNKPENKRGYGVVNGDENVSEFFTVGSVKLQSGDFVYLMSDGIKDFFVDSYENSFNAKDLKDIFKMQEEESKADLDDRTIIRIKF